MSRRSTFVLAGAVSALLSCSIAVHSGNAAQPILSGSWDLTFCSNPDKSCAATVCISFVRVNGLVNSMPISGTWTLPGFVTDGRWVQYGDMVQFSAAYGSSYLSLTGVLDGRNRLGGISFVDATDSHSFINTGNWRALKRNAPCSGADPARSSASGLASDAE